MEGAQRPAYDHAVFRVREALRAFVDACHVLVRQPDGRSDDDTTAVTASAPDRSSDDTAAGVASASEQPESPERAPSEGDQQ